MENRNVYSVSFKRSEKELKEFALTHEGFSEYIKELIKSDKEKTENIFSDEEIKEINRLIEKKLKEKWCP
ncbi:hypothetical protein KS664_002954 [Clostridium perfringens]|nr:hypothetical protein [Clostridium perfringens]EHR0219323.1 hypothetical protein [Clostridium perfringens]ELC8464004.1 hypothetical protein [Clostridium perfringens]MDK0981025.1 hypothetical protein [Clostridium perfringens]MDU0868254.1 hypothetical protein [Clostridium perfringens]